MKKEIRLRKIAISPRPWPAHQRAADEQLSADGRTIEFESEAAAADFIRRFGERDALTQDDLQEVDALYQRHRDAALLVIESDLRAHEKIYFRTA